MINALTVDLEHWYSPELVAPFLTDNMGDDEGILRGSVYPILDLLDEYGTSATFFVLGTVAERYPYLIEEIYGRGHEIASHGYSHIMLDKLGAERFEEEVVRSLKCIKSITKDRPLGFRAPSFSINNSTLWALEILRKYGFKYDSSVFPVKTRLYGVPDAPLHIYKPSAEDVAKEDVNGKILEFPLTVFEFGKRIPVSGGFYLRTMPFRLFKCLLGKINKTREGIIYLHPWETYPEVPRLKLPVYSRFITYHGIGSTLGKLKGLLRHFNFAPAREVLGL